MDIEMRTWYGAPAYFVLGAVHAIVFWLTVSRADAVDPAGRLLQSTQAALHDILVGTVVINNPGRAASLQALHGRLCRIRCLTRRHSRAI